MLDRRSLGLLLGALLLAGGFVGAGLGYLAHERAALLETRQAELAAIARLRVDEVVHWRRERAKEARLDATGVLGDLARAWTGPGGGDADALALLARMAVYRDVQGYRTLALARPDGEVVLSVEPRIDALDGQARQLVGQAVARRDVLVGELTRAQGADRVTLDLAAPIVELRGQPLLVLILRADAAVELFPLVQVWPTPSPNAETLLVRRDGDDVLLLNVLRHRVDPALSVRFPLTNATLPAVQAVLGHQGAFEGRDYRGVEVLAQLVPVPESPWFLVAKVDRAEVFAMLYREAWMIGLVVLLAVLTMGAVVRLVSRTRRLRLHEELLRAERARREAERSLADNAERLRQAVTAGNVGLWERDLATNQVRFSREWKRHIGYAEDEVPDRYEEWERRVHPEDLPTVRRLLESTFQSPQTPYRAEFRFLHRDGSWRRILAQGEVLRDEQGRPSWLLGSHVDLTERWQAEEALRASERWLRALYEESPLGYQSLGPTGLLVDVNPCWLEMLGYRREQVLGRPFSDFLSVDDVRLFQKRFSRFLEMGQIKGAEFSMTRSDGAPLVVSVDGRVAHQPDGTFRQTHCVVRDVTDERRAEREQRQFEASARNHQKLEAIGTLASGVAHEINNPLNIIMNYAELVLEGLPGTDPLREHVGQIGKECERVATIVRNLLAFARPDRDEPGPERVAGLVEDTLSLSRVLLRRDQIDLQCDLPSDLPRVVCRPRQIQQVLMNLVANARDALNQRYPQASPDKILRLAASSFTRAGRHWVRLTVEDHGGGIPPQVAARVFDPFFTTKPRDKGTGLGLSISYSIVKDHHGELGFETEVDHGTRFHVDLRVDGGGLVAADDAGATPEAARGS